MYKKIICVFLVLLILFSCITTTFATDNNNISLLGLDDTFGLQDLIEDTIITKTGYSADNFNSSTRYSYIVCKEPYGYYHILAGYFYITQYNKSYPVFNVVSTSDLRMKIKTNGSNDLKYFTINQNNVSNCSDVVSKTVGAGTYVLDELFDVNVFNYLNLLFINKSNLSFFTTYLYNNFSQRVSVDYPSVDILDVDLATAEYYSIAPMDLYMKVNSNYIVSAFDLNIYKKSSTEGIEDELIYTFNLTHNSSFWFEDDFIFNIPITTIKTICSQHGNGYYYTNTVVSGNGAIDLQSSWYYDSSNDVLDGSISDGSGGSDNDNTNNIVDSIVSSNDKVVNVIQEQTETSKGIWETIKSILNFLNPLSEDFFAYKLVSLLLDMLKSLFIPSDDFFSNYIDELNQQFSDTFGILYYPLDLLIDFFNRIGAINDNSATIHIPQFDISFMGYTATVIKDYTFDFNSILANDTLKKLHDMYLVFVDILLWLGVVYLASNCIKTIVGGMTGEVVDANVSEEKSYKRYEQYQSNKDRYRREHM